MITSPEEKGLAMCKNNQLLGKDTFWARRVHNLAKELSSGLQTSHKASDTGHKWHNSFSVTPVSENSSGVYLGKGEAQMTSEFEENDGGGMARTKSHLFHSNFKLEDMECKGFDDSLESVCETPETSNANSEDRSPKKASLITYNYKNK